MRKDHNYYFQNATPSLDDYCNTCSFEDGIVPYVVKSNDPYDTDFAALVPRFSGSVSFVASALIIYAILRSDSKLTTIYHRIMLGMSISDMMSSAAIALTSLPMPKSMPYERDFGISWSGKRLGNTYSCNAQGFFFTVGNIAMFSYNGALCVYYACAIGFVMRERNIRRYVEPFFHGVPTILGLACGIIPLFYEMYNPSGLVAFCSVVSYPYSCNSGDSCNIRGSKRYHDISSAGVVVYVIILTLIIVISFGFVIYRAIEIDKMIDKKISPLTSMESYQYGDTNDMYDNNSAMVPNVTNNDDESSIVGNILNRRQHMKVIIKQVLGYICALLLSLLFPVLRLSNTMGGYEVIFDKLGLVFMPLQGFFNYIIFTSHKVYNYRRVKSDVSRAHVLMKLFCSSGFKEPVFISRITIVENNGDIDEDDQPNILEIVIDDEAGERSSHFLSVGSDFKLENDEEENHIAVLSLTSMSKFSGNDSAGNDVFADPSESKGDLSEFDMVDLSIGTSTPEG